MSVSMCGHIHVQCIFSMTPGLLDENFEDEIVIIQKAFPFWHHVHDMNILI